MVQGLEKTSIHPAHLWAKISQFWDHGGSRSGKQLGMWCSYLPLPPLFPPIALLLQEMFICRKEEPQLGRWDGDIRRRVTSLEDQKHEDLGSSDADFGFTSAGHPASLLALPCLSFPQK